MKHGLLIIVLHVSVRAGLVECVMVQCPAHTHCGYMYKPENECCPKCGGKMIY